MGRGSGDQAPTPAGFAGGTLRARRRPGSGASAGGSVAELPGPNVAEQVERLRGLPLDVQVEEHARIERELFARLRDLEHDREPGPDRDEAIAAVWAEHADLKRQHPIFEGVPAAWLLSPEEFVEMDFEGVVSNGSRSPKATFEADPEEVWTLLDAAADDHAARELLGNPRRAGEFPSTAHLRPAILADEPITVYRAISDGRYDTGPIIPGSYVTESRQYAEQHGERILAGANDTPSWRIDSMRVRPSELATLGAAHELTWHPKDPTDAHRIVVETAVAQGYWVPPEVLARYPHLDAGAIAA